MRKFRPLPWRLPLFVCCPFPKTDGRGLLLCGYWREKRKVEEGKNLIKRMTQRHGGFWLATNSPAGGGLWILASLLLRPFFPGNKIANLTTRKTCPDSSPFALCVGVSGSERDGGVVVSFRGAMPDATQMKWMEMKRINKKKTRNFVPQIHQPAESSPGSCVPSCSTTVEGHFH